MLQSLCFSVALLLSIGQCLGDFSRTDVVNITTGSVRGVVKETTWNKIKYSAFLGIPYGKPPVDNLRFKPPVPVDPWTGVFDAVHEGTPCAQVDLFTNLYTGSEDCLTLNVFTREYGDESKLKPVMVWIYGGAWTTGYGNTSLYGPDFFLEEDVVFVSFNYRVGALGFLSLDHADALGNQGLKDQLLVLEWVQDNIANFGGDPGQVTIFGESAGGASVGYHLLSERSSGLFSKAMMQSGTPICPWAYFTPAKAVANAEQLAHNLGYFWPFKDGILNYLRNVPVKDLILRAQDIDLGILGFRPAIEDTNQDVDDTAMVTECSINKLNNGDFNKVPLLMGYNKDEALFFYNYLSGEPKRVKALQRLLADETYDAGIMEKMMSLIMAAYNSVAPDRVIENGNEMMDKTFFDAPIDLTQKLLSAANDGHPIFYYRMSYVSNYTSIHQLVGNSVNGTGHMDDVGFMFDTVQLDAPADKDNPFNKFRKTVVHMWANFAKYGNPTPEDDPEPVGVTWVDSTDEGKQLDINQNLTLRDRIPDIMSIGYEDVLRVRLPLTSACFDILKPISYNFL